MARSRHGSPSASTPAHETYQLQQGRRATKRKSSSDQRPRRTVLPDSGMRSPLEDVTDVVLATEYYWSPVSWPQAQSRTMNEYDASAARSYSPEARRETTARLERPSVRKVSNRVRWGDIKEGDDGLATPPRTPQLGRLGTPDLELTGYCDKFCDCCSDEQKYREDRSKMDSQRRFMHTLLLLAAAHCRVEAALAHMRGPPGRELLSAGNDARHARGKLIKASPEN
ncbi:hypothetical protein diail_7477 [Diaporthe ilicicola]|nr:hypothetical protein diail_7477 [Diaporthe ilicicola]